MLQCNFFLTFYYLGWRQKGLFPSFFHNGIPEKKSLNEYSRRKWLSQLNESYRILKWNGQVGNAFYFQTIPMYQTRGWNLAILSTSILKFSIYSYTCYTFSTCSNLFYIYFKSCRSMNHSIHFCANQISKNHASWTIIQ